MKLLDQIQGLWGRTLSSIEIQSIIGFTELYEEKTILEAALISVDKEKPLSYMKKVLINCKKKEEAEQEESSGSAWLDEFNKRFK